MIAFASLSECARNALDRFRLLQPHLEEKRSLTAIARDGGIGYRTAQRWVMRYRKCGLAGLARYDRADRGRRRTITPALKEILEALALQKPPMPIAALHRQLCRIAVERGQPAPNYKAVYRVVRNLPADLVMLAHGDPDVVAKCLKGYQVGNKTFKVHLDGYNLMPFFKGEVKESPWSDDGDVFAIRVGRWKTVFIEQNHEGLDIWRLGFEKLRVPKIFDLLADPFERGDSSLLYDQWLVHHIYLNYGAIALVAEWLQSFKEFPPRQKPASFNLDEVMRQVSNPGPGND